MGTDTLPTSPCCTIARRGVGTSRCTCHLFISISVSQGPPPWFPGRHAGCARSCGVITTVLSSRESLGVCCFGYSDVIDRGPTLPTQGGRSCCHLPSSESSSTRSTVIYFHFKPPNDRARELSVGEWGPLLGILSK